MTEAEKALRNVLFGEENERSRIVLVGARKGRKRLTIVVW